jgi:hypothetical protein
VDGSGTAWKVGSKTGSGEERRGTGRGREYVGRVGISRQEDIGMDRKRHKHQDESANRLHTRIEFAIDSLLQTFTFDLQG